MEYEMKKSAEPESNEPPVTDTPPTTPPENTPEPSPVTPPIDPLSLSDLPPSDREQAAAAEVVKKKKIGHAWRDFWGFIAILVIAGLLSWGMISYVFRSYSVDGPSMESTLQNSDKLIIWKLPRTIARLTGHQYVPGRGDIVVFHLNDLGACGQIGGRDIIKRVIGLPGERVVVSSGTIKVFNSEHPNGFSPDATLPYNKDGHIPTTGGNVEVTLGAGQIFVAGDNRPNSCDSRMFGPVDLNNIIGKLTVRLLPINNVDIF